MIRTYPFYSNWSEVGVSLHIGTGGWVTTVDTSWNEALTGTEQVRFYLLEGDKLIVTTAWAPSVTTRKLLLI